MEFSREALGQASGLPPARAFYALEVMLCAVGKEAGLGTTLLVDCGVGVLAARGRVVKFTFVQVCCHVKTILALARLQKRRCSTRRCDVCVFCWYLSGARLGAVNVLMLDV